MMLITVTVVVVVGVYCHHSLSSCYIHNTILTVETAEALHCYILIVINVDIKLT